MYGPKKMSCLCSDIMTTVYLYMLNGSVWYIFAVPCEYASFWQGGGSPLDPFPPSLDPLPPPLKQPPAPRPSSTSTGLSKHPTLFDCHFFVFSDHGFCGHCATIVGPSRHEDDFIHLMYTWNGHEIEHRVLWCSVVTILFWVRFFWSISSLLYAEHVFVSAWGACLTDVFLIFFLPMLARGSWGGVIIFISFQAQIQ